MNALIRGLSDASDARSLSSRLRARRFALLERCVASFPRPLRILDIGGTTAFWERTGWAGDDRYELTMLNLEDQPRVHRNVQVDVGDATDLSAYREASFDLVFSNSLIEHLFTLENQAAMAREVRRIARAYWIQTPNFWFPMEPHFQWMGWQWMPMGLRVALLRRFRIGWRGPCSDLEKARNLVREIRLLSRSELARLFPEAHLVPEHFLGLTKSWIALFGFPIERERMLL